jgi:ubiquinone/menaquinone biosynthesis C-methylase UbiE
MSEYKQQVINFFNQRTAYDSEGDSHSYEANKLLEFAADIQDGQTVLDLATGTGLVAIAAAKQITSKGSVIGVDMSSGMLSQARSKMSALGIENLELIEADIESVNFSPEQFDVIFCCSAIMYANDICSLLDRCYSWLKSGGNLVFSTSAKTAYWADIQVKVCQDLFGINFPHILRPLWTPEKCQELLKQSGFENIKIECNRQGEYLVLDEYPVNISCEEGHLMPQANPLVNLTASQKKELQSAYQQAINDLVTEDGLWSDRSLLFIKAQKEGQN